MNHQLHRATHDTLTAARRVVGGLRLDPQATQQTRMLAAEVDRTLQALITTLDHRAQTVAAQVLKGHA